MRALAYVVGGAALILNPLFACEGGYSFGMDEIRAALDGTWAATWKQDGVDRTLAFRIEPSAAKRAREGRVGSASACGSRTLVASASACVDDTVVPVTLIAVDGTRMEGTFHVFGFSFERGELRVNAVKAEDSSMFLASISSRGEVLHVSENARVVHIPSMVR